MGGRRPAGALRPASHPASRPRGAPAPAFYPDPGIPGWAIIKWLWALPVAGLIGWVSMRFRPDPTEPPEPVWRGRPLWFAFERLDRASLALIAVAGALLWIGRHALDPLPPDALYHLMVARRIYEDGTIPSWNSWEFAPLGRPHLYPPLYHLLIALGGLAMKGDLEGSWRIVQSLMLPGTLFGVWYMARWLFDARRAFVALLLAGMDCSLWFTGLLGTPSVLATAIMMPALVLFLAGRWGWATALTTAALYTHLGTAPTALIALGVFSLIHRRYLSPFLAMAGLALLCALPWYARVFVYRDWFSHPLESGVYGAIPAELLPLRKLTWLQLVNLTLLLLIAKSMLGIRWRESRYQLILISLATALPLLVSYGGRYYTHTLHLWAMLAAGLFVQRLAPPVSWRRLGAAVALASAPSVGIIGTGTPVPPGAYPVPSGWIIAPVIAFSGSHIFDRLQLPGYVSRRNAEAIASRLRELTAPGQIIAFQGDRDFALIVAWYADRPIDTGAWEETQPNRETKRLIDWYAARDPSACIVSRSWIGIPEDMVREEVGGAYIAYRQTTRGANPNPTDAPSR